MNRSIAVLMPSLFTVGSAEFVIAGLLPSITTDLDVTISAAGMLVSAYAIAIVLAGPAITLLTARFPRKPLMLGLMVLFVVSNALGAIAPNYEVLMTTRVTSALTHCTFFALALVVGAGAAPANRQGAVIARLAIGLNMANVLGVPLGTLLATNWGWRSTLWAVAIFGAIATVLLIAVIPAEQAPKQTPTNSVLGELRVLRRRPVLMAIAMSALSCGGVFAAYTFALGGEVGAHGKSSWRLKCGRPVMTARHTHVPAWSGLSSATRRRLSHRPVSVRQGHDGPQPEDATWTNATG